MGFHHLGLLGFPFFALPDLIKAFLRQHHLFGHNVAHRAWLQVRVSLWLFSTNYSIWKVDSSVAIMLLVTKLTYYGKWLDKKVKDEISFVDYLSYTLFVPSVIAGPTFSFEIYLAYLNNKFDVSLKKMKVLKALEPLAVAIPLIALSVYVIPTFHTRWVL